MHALLIGEKLWKQHPPNVFRKSERIVSDKRFCRVNWSNYKLVCELSSCEQRRLSLLVQKYSCCLKYSEVSVIHKFPDVLLLYLITVVQWHLSIKELGVYFMPCPTQMQAHWEAFTDYKVKKA